MRNAVIVGYKRSPFTFARKGEMANIRPEDILSQTINKLLNEIQINKNAFIDIKIIIYLEFKLYSSHFTKWKLIINVHMITIEKMNPQNTSYSNHHFTVAKYVGNTIRIWLLQWKKRDFGEFALNCWWFWWYVHAKQMHRRIPVPFQLFRFTKFGAKV